MKNVMVVACLALTFSAGAFAASKQIPAEVCKAKEQELKTNVKADFIEKLKTAVLPKIAKLYKENDLQAVTGLTYISSTETAHIFKVEAGADSIEIEVLDYVQRELVLSSGDYMDTDVIGRVKEAGVKCSARINGSSYENIFITNKESGINIGYATTNLSANSTIKIKN